MSAPTGVFVQAAGKGKARLDWTYTGSNTITIYRSTDGTSYTNITDTPISATVKQYIDSGLADATKYYYKLSDDSGSTYSNVVTITTHTFCVSLVNTPGLIERAIDEVTPDMFNAVVERLEAQDNQDVLNPPCIVCSNDNTLIINCLDNCNHFELIMTENINSISVVGCDGCPNIDFIIGPEQTYSICGWPDNCGFEGGECANVSTWITGPKVFHSSTGVTQKLPGFNDDDEACPCLGTLSILPQIQCCMENIEDCELYCDEDNTILLKVCGGYPPYTWSGSDNIIISAAPGAVKNNKVNVKLANPNNAQPAVVPAFVKTGVKLSILGFPLTPNAGLVTFIDFYTILLDCNGNIISNTSSGSYGHTHCGQSIYVTSLIFKDYIDCGPVRFSNFSQSLGNYPDEVSITAFNATVTHLPTGNSMNVTYTGWNASDETVSGCYPCVSFPCVQCDATGHWLPCTGTGANYNQCRCFDAPGVLDIRTPEQIDAGCAEPCPSGDNALLSVSDVFGGSVTISIPINL